MSFITCSVLLSGDTFFFMLFSRQLFGSLFLNRRCRNFCLPAIGGRHFTGNEFLQVLFIQRANGITARFITVYFTSAHVNNYGEFPSQAIRWQVTDKIAGCGLLLINGSFHVPQHTQYKAVQNGPAEH